MPLTKYNVDTLVSRGFVTLGVVDAIADINAPTLTEIDTGITYECATEAFENSSSVDAATIDWLCDPVSESLPGNITHEIGDLKIKWDPQDSELIDQTFTPGTTKYLWRRDGIAHDEAPTAGQLLWIWEVKITSVDPSPVANAAGDYLALIVHVTVMRRTDLPVAIAASV